MPWGRKCSTEVLIRPGEKGTPKWSVASAMVMSLVSNLLRPSCPGALWRRRVSRNVVLGVARTCLKIVKLCQRFRVPWSIEASCGVDLWRWPPWTRFLSSCKSFSGLTSTGKRRVSSSSAALSLAILATRRGSQDRTARKICKQPLAAARSVDADREEQPWRNVLAPPVRAFERRAPPPCEEAKVGGASADIVFVKPLGGPRFIETCVPADRAPASRDECEDLRACRPIPSSSPCQFHDPPGLRGSAQ